MKINKIESAESFFLHYKCLQAEFVELITNTICFDLIFGVIKTLNFSKLLAKMCSFKLSTI